MERLPHHDGKVLGFEQAIRQFGASDLACLNGDANCVLANTSALHDYVESGQLIPLVQFNKTTFDDPTWGLDPIPSVAEVGYPDIAVEPCSILCCRKDADPVGVEAMRRIITDYLSSDQGIADMAEIGLSSDVISAEDAYQRLSAEIDTFKMIKDSSIDSIAPY